MMNQHEEIFTGSYSFTKYILHAPTTFTFICPRFEIRHTLTTGITCEIQNLPCTALKKNSIPLYFMITLGLDFNNFASTMYNIHLQTQNIAKNRIHICLLHTWKYTIYNL